MRSADESSSFWWRAHDDEPPAGPGWWPIGEASYREREVRITGHHFLEGPAPAWADDLLRVARAAFLADKLVAREPTADRWTRNLRLSVPVSEPERWQEDGGAGDVVESLLGVLTGDRWELLTRVLPSQPAQAPLPSGRDWRPDEIALFSGGLDSLSWAAERAAVAGQGPLLLVGFHEPKARDVQQRVHEAVKSRARESGRRVLRLTPSQMPRGEGGRKTVELSSRPRGLLYVATAVRAAAASRVASVQIPENGQVALNPPLTAARTSALSTRSVHPWSLHLLNSAIRDIGGAVTVTNPLARLTKGEVCRKALDARISPTVLADTLSCGHPPIRRGRKYTNCGVCFPCLVRRSGILAACGFDATDYEKEPWDQKLSARRRRDWHALRLWLARPYGIRDIIADQPLPPDTDIASWLRVVRAGRAELRNLVGPE
ncbi:7-cyano-7-deazaguanine synthase [Streptomyces sp. CBMA29]|uniref:7-cyano-7-deazaguanine synthase n=1 Tax=Streptomyces sp. CBMA29 TaxID=1896314 RepID=UPI00166210CD|nr:7-cyano-7-deazaguanine synthase [Streptomyces sp. CBMA29]MBD0735468.1 hypothetical protein [Streptomyces sp. CBMA29]